MKKCAQTEDVPRNTCIVEGTGIVAHFGSMRWSDASRQGKLQQDYKLAFFRSLKRFCARLFLSLSFALASIVSEVPGPASVASNASPA